MMQSTLPETLVEADVSIPAPRSALASASSTAVLCFAIAACGFPRPPDISGDDAGGSDGAAGPNVAIQVSPSGDDANDGHTLPIKTLKHALGLAAANTQIAQIVLANGTYSMSSGETFPYTIPPNVSLIGPAGGGATLVGGKTGPGVTINVGALQDVDLQDFTIAITVTGRVALKNIRVLTSAIALQAETTADITVSNLDITGVTGVCATGIVLNGNARLTLSAFATRLLGTSFLANDHSTASLTNINVAGDPSCSSPNAVLRISSDGSFMISQVLIDAGGNGIGVGSPSGQAPTQVVLEDVTVRNVSMALDVGNATVHMVGGELSHSGTAFEVIGGNCTLTDVSILSSGVAFYSQESTLTMRGCTVSNNTIGGDLSGGVLVDLGTTMSPGKNVFNNTGIGLTVEGDNGTQLVQLVGNTWKPVQGADANGKYVQGTIVPGPISCDPNSHGNVCLDVSNESLEL